MRMSVEIASEASTNTSVVRLVCPAMALWMMLRAGMAAISICTSARVTGGGGDGDGGGDGGGGATACVTVGTRVTLCSGRPKVAAIPMAGKARVSLHP